MASEAPPLTAKQEHGVRSREEILDAADRLMGTHGYAATSIRTEGVRRLRRALKVVYAPWGEAVARRVGAELCDLAIALFDGLFIAGHAAEVADAVLADRAVTALHALAEGIRTAAS